jgi:hypothetical protein
MFRSGRRRLDRQTRRRSTPQEINVGGRQAIGCVDQIGQAALERFGFLIRRTDQLDTLRGEQRRGFRFARLRSSFHKFDNQTNQLSTLSPVSLG